MSTSDDSISKCFLFICAPDFFWLADFGGDLVFFFFSFDLLIKMLCSLHAHVRVIFQGVHAINPKIIKVLSPNNITKK